MKKPSAIIACALVLLIAGAICAETRSATDLLEKARRKFDVIKDYSADIRLDMKGDKVSIKGMGMKLYYKKPDKTRVVAKQGFAALPKDLMLGSMIEQVAKSTRGSLLRTEKKHGAQCYVIQLDPTQPAPQAPSVLLWLDKSRLLIVATSSLGPQKFDTTWTYTRVDGKYDMPSKIEADITMPGERGSRPSHATVTFTNYRINKGISDSVFREPKKP